MSQIAPDYTMKRMLDDYIDRFYHKLATRTDMLTQNKYAEARKLVEWKKDGEAHWDRFQVETFEFEEKALHPIVGEEYTTKLVIDRKALKSMLGVELVYSRENPETHAIEFVSAIPFMLKQEEGTKLYFELKRVSSEFGHLKVGIRVFPTHEKLPNRMDFAYLRWLTP